MKRARIEDDLQKSVATFLDAVLPKDTFWSSIDHAGGGVLVGKNRKARGVKKGLPDVLIIWAGKTFWIELKAPGEYPDTDQKAIHERLRTAGCEGSICRTLDEVEKAVLGFGFRLKGGLAA